MMKFFTTLLFLLVLCFSIVAQQKKPAKPIPGKKSYTKKLPIKSTAKTLNPKKPVAKPTAKKTSNLPAPGAYRNIEKPFTFNGQWKGGFLDNSMGFIGFGGERIDYVLELESNGAEVKGYSYTYFSDRGKRYYTICKLRGTINRATKEVVVTEYERTKYNTPPDMSNCFQTHKLKYVKENADSEILQGTWVPAPNQNGNCGYGVTSLARRIVRRVNEQKVYVPPAKINQPSKDISRAQQPTTKQTKPVVKEQNKKSVITSKPPVVKNNNPIKNNQSPKKDTVKKEISAIKAPSKKVEPDVISNTKFEKRENKVLKTIPIKNETFTVDFYDNGEIDGDSISVFYNGKLVLSHKRLTDKPITITLSLDPDKTVNELVMYAENLGEIPPNTALMIIRDGDNRYEARITSDIKKNGTIRFSH